MRKGESKYDVDRIPIEFYPIPLAEEWREVTEKEIPDIQPYYLISNYGRIFHKYAAIFMQPALDTKGYLYTMLAKKNGSSVAVRNHRLEMLVFKYFDGCENMVVNILDGIKTNCIITNLEWASYPQNRMHTIRKGLNGSVSYTKEQVEKVCELLEKQYIPITTIANEVGVSVAFVASIQGKRAHTDISDKYNILPRKVNNNLSTDEVKMLCQYYQDHPKDDILDNYCKRALESIGIKNISSREIRSAKKIFSKETYDYISCNYNF